MPLNAVLRPNFPCMHAFRHEESDFESTLKPEVEFMVFLRMRSNKITKNGGKCP